MTYIGPPQRDVDSFELIVAGARQMQTLNDFM